MLIALLLSCDPCASWSGVEVQDPEGVLSEDVRAELLQAHDDFRTWTGADDVCLNRIRVRELDDHDYFGHGRTLDIDPDFEPTARSVRWALCTLLDRRRDYTGLRPDLFGEDASSDFADVCMEGPEAWAWRDQVLAACGQDQLDERTTFLADDVYRFALPGRRDGVLESRVGPTMRLEDVMGDDRRVSQPASLGSDIVVDFHELHPSGRSTDTLWRIDPATGTVQVLWEEWDVSFRTLLGGREHAVAIFSGDPSNRMIVADSDGATTEWSVAPSSYWDPLAVAHGALWGRLFQYETGPLVRIDLETGERTEVALPEPIPGVEMLVSALVEIDGGLYAELYQATVDSGGDTIYITLYSFETWMLDLDDDSWTPLTTDLQLIPAGSEGFMVLGSLYSSAGRVLAAYDTASDQLLVSTDQCVVDQIPRISTGGIVWTVRNDGEDVVYQGYELDW